ncbi:hypothetical protein WJX72_011992 [[Myrmecia] bisecta]|uniref:Uncharacterized protein n=1 Tax=[Myrmecia] bisecta TaxID=41462 RepID=A0AAW1P5I7_9CHLO
MAGVLAKLLLFTAAVYLTWNLSMLFSRAIAGWGKGRNNSISTALADLTSEQRAVYAALSAHTCGSPAVDGYAHVDATCLAEAPTMQWWKAWTAGGGKPEDLRVHYERRADYDGVAVQWGLGNQKASVEECGEACRQHRPGSVKGPFQDFPCNAFAWCAEEQCFEPDAHVHTKGDCWLKFTEGPANPEVNFRGALVEDWQERHPTAPDHVQWHTGVVLPPGIPLNNGTWSPRYFW